MMNGIFLLLGSNLGDKKLQLSNAAFEISQQIGTIIKSSSRYKTLAWGKTDQPDFLNQVIEVSFEGTASSLLEKTQRIELMMGRTREEKWGARTIDIDILFMADKIINEKNLQIPHPQIQYRKFTLVPLAEIAPGFVHPVLHQSISQLLNDCTDPLEVTKVEL